MTTIDEKNLLDFLTAYFASLGLGAEARDYFTAKAFSEGLVLKLPAVCLVPENKPASCHSKQTHIHVTGNNRYFFFSAGEIDTATATTPDRVQNLLVSEQNLCALNGTALAKRGLFFHPSHMMVKISCRTAQSPQVQLGKLRQDGELFVSLRHALYEDDLLVFLKLRTGNAMVAVGIPHAFYAGQYEFPRTASLYLESRGTVTVKNALASVMNEFADSDVIESDAVIADAVYQEMVNNAPAPAADPGPVLYTPAAAVSRSSACPATDPALGKDVLCRSSFRCAVDASHLTFLKKDEQPYMEIHHLIPLEQQTAFPYRLDTRANLVPVCPLCHRLLHYGRMAEKRPILARLYRERQDALQKSGLRLTLEELLAFYE